MDTNEANGAKEGQVEMALEEPLDTKTENKVEEAVTDEVTEETELERLQRELEEAKAQAAEYLDGWQRSQAEFANYRKRREADRQQQMQMSNAFLIAKILPMLDDLSRAFDTIPAGIKGLTWIEGVLLIQRKLEMVLESEGVTPIETADQTFNPLYHEAVTYEIVAGFEEGQIISEVQRGYMLGERVIRPALVRVAQAMPVPVEAEKNKEEEDKAAEATEETD